MLEFGQINNYTEYEHEIVFEKDRKILFPLKRPLITQKESTLPSQLCNIAILCTFVTSSVTQLIFTIIFNSSVINNIFLFL
jgi:hypothetical protein